MSYAAKLARDLIIHTYTRSIHSTALCFHLWGESSELHFFYYSHNQPYLKFLLTFIRPPLSSSLSLNLASTTLFKSLCSRRPKSLNIVDPPESTTFCGDNKNTVFKSIFKASFPNCIRKLTSYTEHLNIVQFPEHAHSSLCSPFFFK